MAAKAKSAGKAKDDLEIVPDAWERFESAVDLVIKSGPKHREASKGSGAKAASSQGVTKKQKS